MYRKLIGIGALAIALLAWSGPALAGGVVKRPDLTVFSALSVGQSARAIGMGSAYTAAGNDINTIWWNPAGLAGVEGIEASFSHSEWFVNSSFNTAAVAYHRGVNAFGLSLVTFDPGQVEERTILQPQGTGRMLSLGDVAAAATYARQFTDKLTFGVRFLWAREDLDLTQFSTFNVDFGTLFYTGLRSLRLSMTMRNFGKDTSVLRRQFQQPLTFNLGGAAEVYGAQGDPIYATASFEMNYAINYEERYHLGGEAWILNALALRAGYMFNYDGFDFTTGAGLRVPFSGRYVTADFAWQHSKNGLNAPLRFSLGFKL